MQPDGEVLPPQVSRTCELEVLVDKLQRELANANRQLKLKQSELEGQSSAQSGWNETQTTLQAQLRAQNQVPHSAALDLIAAAPGVGAAVQCAQIGGERLRLLQCCGACATCSSFV